MFDRSIPDARRGNQCCKESSFRKRARVVAAIEFVVMVVKELGSIAANGHSTGQMTTRQCIVEYNDTRSNDDGIKTKSLSIKSPSYSCRLIRLANSQILHIARNR